MFCYRLFCTAANISFSNRCTLSCQDDDKSSSICEIDKNVDVTTRFYDIQITASDAAGNEGTKTCSAIVIPEDHYCNDGMSSTASKSSKRCGSKGSKSTGSVLDGVGARRALHQSEESFSLYDDSRALQGLVTKSIKSSKGINQEEHNPDDLRMEFTRSTQRYVITELSLEWDPNLDTTLLIPPLPEVVPSGLGSKGSKSTKGTGDGALKSTKGGSGETTCWDVECLM